MLVGRLRIKKVLGATGKAFHRDEVLTTDEAQRFAKKWDLDGAGEKLWIHATETAQQINLVCMAVSQYEERWNGVIGITAAQFGRKPGALKDGTQLCKALGSRPEECVDVG